MSMNDGVKRGDSARTGDLAALPDEDILDLQADGIGSDGTASIDDLTIVSEDDPSLGLTAHGDAEPQDWAANSGPTRNPDRGVATDSISDTGSTLGPDRG